MTTLNMLGFTAELSLGPSMNIYRKQVAFGGSSQSKVYLQQFSASFNFENLLPRIRCCRRDPISYQFVCFEKAYFPWENCYCSYGVPVCTLPIVGHSLAK